MDEDGVPSVPSKKNGPILNKAWPNSTGLMNSINSIARLQWAPYYLPAVIFLSERPKKKKQRKSRCKGSRSDFHNCTWLTAWESPPNTVLVRGDGWCGEEMGRRKLSFLPSNPKPNPHFFFSSFLFQ